MFKEGIKPVWEDDANRKVLFRLSDSMIENLYSLTSETCGTNFLINW